MEFRTASSHWPCRTGRDTGHRRLQKTRFTIRPRRLGTFGTVARRDAGDPCLRSSRSAKNKVLIEDVERFALSLDGPSCFIHGRPRRALHGIIDAKPSDTPHKVVTEAALKLAGMRAEVDPPQEWKQMFNEVWRQERDYFYRKVDERRRLAEGEGAIRATYFPMWPTVTA